MARGRTSGRGISFGAGSVGAGPDARRAGRGGVPALLGAALALLCLAGGAPAALGQGQAPGPAKGAVGDEGAGSAAAAPSEAPSDALDAIRRRGTLRLGYRLDAPPFSYVDEQGRASGLSVRLCEAAAPHIAAEAGLDGPADLVWIAVTAASRFDALKDGRIDLLCGPTTQTLSRRREMDFSIPYYVDGAGIVFRKGGPESLAALTNEPVGVLRGTTTETVARQVLAEKAPGAVLRLYDSHVAGLGALQKGEVEAYLGDLSILLYQLGRMRPTVQPAIGRRMLSREPYALALPLGETRLRLAVDQALSRLYATGEIRRLIGESLGRVDLSPEIEAIYEVVAIPE